MSVKKQQRIVLWAGNWKEKKHFISGPVVFYLREQAAALMSNRFSNHLVMFFGRIILKMCLICSLLHSQILLCNAPPHKEESYLTTQKKNGRIKDHLGLRLEVHLIFDCYRLTKVSHFTIIHDKELECFWVKGILKLVTEVPNKSRIK